jgi:hypothetical protein
MPLYPKIVNLGPRYVEYDSTIYTTLQDAVDYCEILTESAVTDFDGVTLTLPPGDFTAQTILIKKHVSLVGTNKTQIGTITYRPTSAVSGPRTVSLKNILVQNLNVLAETAAASGIFYPDIFDGNFNIEDCQINTIIANRINIFRIKNCYLDGGTAVYTYCSNVVYISGKPGSVEIHVDDTATNPPTNGSAGTLYFIDAFVNGLVDLYKDAGTTTAFLGIYNSYVETLTLNGDCDVAIRGSGSINQDNLTLLNTNNNFVEHESWGAYNPTTPGDWTSAPIWIREALDELAARPSGGAPADGDKGDITVTTSGTVWTIDNDVITNAKAANMATKTYKGRTTAGTGDPEDVAVATLKTDLVLVKADVGLGSVVNADTTTTANITDSLNKRFVTDANLTTIGNQSGINTGDQTITLTSDVTGSGTGSFATTIANDVVTNAKLSNMPSHTVKGNNTAGTADPIDLTQAQLTAEINSFTSVLSGAVPASGGGTTNFLRADGTWNPPSAASGYATVEDEGTPLTQRTNINFVGAGVTASDSGGKTIVTIPGGAGSGATGTTTVNFGVFPGSSDTSVTITGQASIVSGSIVRAWIRPEATADHSVDEHLLEEIKIVAGNIVAATGFTIYAFCDNKTQCIPTAQARGQSNLQNCNNNKLTGSFTVQWKWE